ncbi:MFS transporter [Arthrobacter sp. EpRS71]|uniref:MFS transporter n=1 Tax=Arthrobacter sp. EpRS71 TaxID=1743141 RepID=UPI00074A5B3A|nr:MFS transporter [Arthrobacter sp. EpRS71]KUM36364.1 hypothetical protein AR689_20770 [Arthrobacter sp. EpRS71]
MVGYRALAEGADPLYLGALASSFALPALLAAIPAGRVADKAGGTLMAFAGLVIAGGGIGALVVFPGLVPLLISSVVIGLGQLLIMVGQQTFVAHASAGGSADSAFGTLTAASSVGQLIGPPAVTFAASLVIAADSPTPDTTLGLLVCLGLTLMAMPAFFFLRRIDAGLRRGRQLQTKKWAMTGNKPTSPGLWRSMLVSGAVLVTMDLMYAFVPVWATDAGVSAATVGILLALRAAVSVVSRVGLGWLIGLLGRKATLIASIAAATVALIALPLSDLYGAIAVMIGLGIGLGIPQPLTMAWVIALTDPTRHGAALGLRLTVNRFAQLTLPLAVGALAAPLGVSGIFWSNAGLLAGAIAVAAGADVTGPSGKAVPDVGPEGDAT